MGKQVARAEVVEAEDGSGWYWHLTKNGNVLCHSEVYARKHRATEMRDRVFGLNGAQAIDVVGV